MGLSFFNFKIKLDKFFFFLFIFFLPSQVGKHFWFDFSYLKGVRVDYYAPTVYLTSVLFFLVIVFWFFRKRQELRKKALKFFARRIYWVLVLVVCLAGNILAAQAKELVFLAIFKLVYIFFLFWYVVSEVKKGDCLKLFLLLGIGGLLEGFVSLGQWLNQSSLGGVWWYWGERSFNLSTAGIARAIVDGGEVLRAYGTFSHPNSMAGYLVLLLFLMMILWGRARKKSILFLFFWWLVVIAIALGVVLSFSRLGVLGLLMFMAAGVFEFLKERMRQEKRILYVFILGGVFLFLIFWFWQGVERLLIFERETVVRRREMNISSLAMVGGSPVFGVGMNNYILRLSEMEDLKELVRWYQPEHNVYLLVLAEGGIAGLAIFIYFIGYFLKKGAESFYEKKPYWFLGGILFILVVFLFDHYFLTLEQNQLLMAVFLGVGAGKNS